jgi:hypothetical protein
LEGGFGWVKQIGGWEALVGAFSQQTHHHFATLAF